MQLLTLRPPLHTFALAALLFLSWPAGAGAEAPETPPPADNPWNLTLFHTNDFHSYFLPRPAVWRDDGKMVGGVIPLAWHLADQRRTVAHDIFLDAGDFMTGNPVCNLEVDGVPGAAVAEMMTLLGYDVGVVGNHEFDVGAENARLLAARFGYPLLGGDIVDAEGRPVFRREPVILEKGGLRIGVMGFSCSGMEEVVAPSRLRGLAMADQAELIIPMAAALDPATDLIVVITHNGVDGDKELASRLEGSGVDIIVGGHSHTRLKQPLEVGGILIVQAGSKMTNLGRLDLRVEDDRVVDHSGLLVDLWSDGTFADEELTRVVQGYEKLVQDRFGRQIGTLAQDLRKGRGETNIGNWLSDVIRGRAEADVAFINSGGIRKALNQGPVTALDINEMLPFANSIVVVELTGRQLGTVVQQNADAAVAGQHGILQVSGISYTYRRADGGETAAVEEILVGTEPLALDGIYRVAMPDFVAMMAPVYLRIDLPDYKDLGVTLTAAAVAAVEREQTVVATIEGRIRELE
jgi:2',3'-cyclic-nucleotide 2'-phosphodiesterase (5'-nucleotidase family)